MTPWLLLAITIALAYITYDAFALRTGDYKKRPSQFIAKELGQDISHLSPEEQERLARYNRRYGIGDVDNAPWPFLLFFLFSAAATVFEFLR